MEKYYDLNVPIENDLTETAKKVERLAKFGYNVIALSTLYTPTCKRKRGGKKRTEADNEEITSSHKEIAEKISKIVTEKPRNFKILTRVTVVIDNPDQVRCLQQDYVRSFDIVAIRPTNDKLFLQACTQMEHIDIISLDIDNKLAFKVKHSTARAAIQRGLFVELSYASAIRSSSLRKIVLSNAVSLVRYCNGKGIIFTSAGEHFMEMRAPKDIINLASMFGLKSNEANDTISKSCRCVVLHAYARLQTAKSVITMRKIGEQSNNLERIAREDENIEEDLPESIPDLKRAKQA